MRKALLSIALASSLLAASSARAASWPDSFTARLEALALIQTLNADLLSHDSATLTLDRWCADHHLASPPTITAERIRDADKPPTAELRQALGVDADEPVRYRRVRLHCGDRTLSEADNWYVPARLTPAMNQALDTTDVAFGRVAQPLRFHRRILSARLLWAPLPEGWEMVAAKPGGERPILDIPASILEHRAVLALPDGTPISLVVETYKRGLLDFPEPRQH